jgi:Alginate export
MYLKQTAAIVCPRIAPRSSRQRRYPFGNWRANRACAPVLILLLVSSCQGAARAQDAGNAPAPARPAIMFNRWQEDWSALAGPALRTDPLDSLKYIPLSPADPKSYISFGAGLRERFESNDAPSFGVGHQSSTNYLLQRFELSADIHPDANWQIFTQIQDDRAFWKGSLTPADQDKLDVEQAFVAYTAQLLGGELKARAGRQEMGFDLQRFVAVRDGPDVRQAFDAIWVDWEQAPWRVISFWSQPVQYRTVSPFDDYSNSHFQYGGFRIERANVGPGSISAYYSNWMTRTSCSRPATSGAIILISATPALPEGLTGISRLWPRPAVSGRKRFAPGRSAR